MGQTDIEDSLQRLDVLTQEEVRMATVEGLKATHRIVNDVEDLGGQLKDVSVSVEVVGDQVAGA